MPIGKPERATQDRVLEHRFRGTWTNPLQPLCPLSLCVSNPSFSNPSVSNFRVSSKFEQQEPVQSPMSAPSRNADFAPRHALENSVQ
jgi:hypothetical protein